MDLLKGPIRDGSRGGRAEFKWSDIKDSKDREYYLGVSVKAPAGRWQQNRDIQWYAKGSADSSAAEKARAEEIRKIKEAEQDALSEALGFKVPKRRPADEGLSQGEIDRAIKEAENGEDLKEEDGDGKGVGFGRFNTGFVSEETEVMAGNAGLNSTTRNGEWNSVKLSSTATGRRHGEDDRRRRDRENGKSHRYRAPRKDRSRSRERHKKRSRSRSRDRGRNAHYQPDRIDQDKKSYRHRSRTLSPERHHPGRRDREREHESRSRR